MSVNYEAMNEERKRQVAIDFVKRTFYSLLGVPEKIRYNDYTSELLDAMALEIAILTGLYTGERVVKSRVRPIVSNHESDLHRKLIERGKVELERGRYHDKRKRD